MKHSFAKKILSFALTFAMAFQASSLTAWAADNDSKTTAGIPSYNTYTAVGDSVGAGYGLIDGVNLGQYYFQNNYTNSPQDSYPQLVSNATESTLYNDGILAFLSDDYISTLLDPEFVQRLYPTFEEDLKIPAKDCAYHYLLIDTMKQADLLTLHIGNNDLIQGMLLFDFHDFAMGDDAVYNTETGRYDNLANPFAWVVYSTLVQMLYTGNFSITDDMINSFTSDLELYSDQITAEDLMKTLEFFKEDNLTDILSKYGDTLAANYDTLLQLITKGMTITEEQYNTLKTGYDQADAKLASGDVSDEAEDGKLSEKEILTNGRLDISENDDGTYSIAPINPDAQLAVVSCYNPYGSSYQMTTEDISEVTQFMMNLMKAVVGTSGVGTLTTNDLQEYVSGSKTSDEIISDTQTSQKTDSGSSESKVDSSTLSELLQNIPYSVLYYTLGQPSEAGIEYTNDRIKEVADKYNVPYVDILDMPSDEDVDPHPKAAGHAYIAQKIEETLLTQNLTFTDVPDDAYYTDAVTWAIKNGVTKGFLEADDTYTFRPNTSCTRAQMVTFLWNAEGQPEPKNSTKNPFTDVSSDSWYYKAVMWALENGITAGTSLTTFSPDNTVSRAETVTFLYNHAGRPSSTATNPFTDVKRTSWYYQPVMWAVENNITAGTGNNCFSPNDDCTRAQIVTFLYHYLGD